MGVLRENEKIDSQRNIDSNLSWMPDSRQIKKYTPGEAEKSCKDAICQGIEVSHFLFFRD